MKQKFTQIISTMTYMMHSVKILSINRKYSEQILTVNICFKVKICNHLCTINMHIILSFKEYKNKKEHLTFSKCVLKFYINICFRIFSLYIMNAN